MMPTDGDHLARKVAELQEQLRVTTHARQVQNLLVQVLTGQTREDGLQTIIRYLTRLADADLGYMVFAKGVAVLSVDLYDATGVHSLQMAESLDPTALPREVAWRKEVSRSLYGNLPVTASLFLPILHQGTLIGFCEIARTRGEIENGRAQRLATVFRHIKPVLTTLYAHVLDRRQISSMSRAINERTEYQDILINNTHDLICTFEPDGRIVEINKPGRALLMLADDEAPGLLGLHNPDIAFLIDQLEKTGCKNDFEVILLTKTAKEVFCLASFVGIRDSANRIERIYGIFKDISDRVESQCVLWKANMQLSALNEQLEESTKAIARQDKLASIGQLAAGIAHEINNPLGFVQSNYATLKRYIDRISLYIAELEKFVDNIPRIRAAIKIDKVFADLPGLIKDSDEGMARIAKIVQSLKDFSRIDSSGKATVMDLNKAIADTMVVARNSWKYVAEISTDFGLAEPVECLGDELNQVFLNLIVNAAQAIEAQRRPSPGHINISTRSSNNSAIITIQDDGPGIPADIKSRVFDPFFTTKPVGVGTGLGLSISYDIVTKRHAGTLTLDDVPGGGARFVISIPLLFNAGATEVNDALE